MILVSACLWGADCKYNGGNNRNDQLINVLQNEQIVLVCPEQAGGLQTPRPPCEIVEGDGHDVLRGAARVVCKNGKDLSDAFIRGAREVLQAAQTTGADLVIFKSRSPSCGVGTIYDGTFSSRPRHGDGVACALLKENGFRVVSDEEFLCQGRSTK